MDESREPPRPWRLDHKVDRLSTPPEIDISSSRGRGRGPRTEGVPGQMRLEARETKKGLFTPPKCMSADAAEPSHARDLLHASEMSTNHSATRPAVSYMATCISTILFAAHSYRPAGTPDGTGYNNITRLVGWPAVHFLHLHLHLRRRRQ